MKISPKRQRRSFACASGCVCLFVGGGFPTRARFRTVTDPYGRTSRPAQVPYFVGFVASAGLAVLSPPFLIKVSSLPLMTPSEFCTLAILASRSRNFCSRACVFAKLGTGLGAPIFSASGTVAGGRGV